MRRARIAWRSLVVVACAFLTLNAGAVSAKSSGNVIQIWSVGSPHKGTLPPAFAPSELRQRAESLGYSIEVKTFRASGFAARFRQALQDHSEPEILVFDNYGVIAGVKTQKGWVEGIDADRSVSPSLVLVHETLSSLQSLGWIMLVRSAVNYEAARALSMPPAECESAPVDSPALRLAQEKAELATRAYLDCDRSALAAISDESRLVQQCFMPKSDTKIDSVKACRVSGNQKLAFVTLVSSFSAALREPDPMLRSRPGMELGQKSILAVLRNQNGNWQLLAITHDLMNTVARVDVTNAWKFVKSLDQGGDNGIRPEPARSLAPDGSIPRPQPGERFGDFTWEPSSSADVIGQVVEFSWGKDTNSGLTRLFFLPASEIKLSHGLLMSGGATAWRVWSISKSGDVAFSEQRSYVH